MVQLTALRIAMVAACPVPWPRGTPIRVHRMAEALQRCGHHVRLWTYALHDQSMPTNYQTMRVGPMAKHEASPGPSFRKTFQLNPLLIKKLAFDLKKTPVDVIYAHHVEGLVIASLARKFAFRGKRRPPILFDAHTLLAVELPSYGQRVPAFIKSRAGAALDLTLPRLADHCIAVSSEIETMIREHHGPAHVSLVPNGVEFDHFAQHVDETGDEAGVRPAMIGFSGNLASYQGVDLLLQAMAIARRQKPDLRLMMLTDHDFGPYRGLASTLGLDDCIDLEAPSFADLPAALQRASVLVNPRPHCTGIPQKLLNYMASGKPIISFDGSANGLVDGQSARIVKSGDSDAMARSIIELLDNPSMASGLGRAAQATARRDHSWQSVATQITAICQRQSVGVA